MLIGEYEHSIDTKGRLIMPSKLKEDIGEKFVITQGLDGCLFVYSKKEWDSESSSEKILLRKTDNSYYAVKIENSKNKLSLTEEELNECFMLMS